MEQFNIEDARKRFDIHQNIYTANNVGRRVACLVSGKSPQELKQLPKSERKFIGKQVAKFISEVDNFNSLAENTFFKFDQMMADVTEAAKRT